jgi:hypothetical protein
LLREKGQFWTPAWVAEAMVAFATAGQPVPVFDPAVGGGAFLLAALKLFGAKAKFAGTEVDPDALKDVQAAEAARANLSQVQIRDFVLDPPDEFHPAIVANPPYIRHHRLGAPLKGKLRRLGLETVGKPLDGRAGIHVYFLIRALQRLAKGGRLAFIMPADTCEGVFAPLLWRWVASNYRLVAVVTFAPEAAPFPGVDTNALIFCLENAAPGRQFFWARCLARSPELGEWLREPRAPWKGKAIRVQRRTMKEGLRTGLSRGARRTNGQTAALGDYCKVLRGVATGANAFFFLTRERAEALSLGSEFLVPAVGRTRDVTGPVLSREVLRQLESKGRPTLLFSPDGRPLDHFPAAARAYLRVGERAGLPARPLLATRRPWYKMERREIPLFLFAYLGRRNARFIKNEAAVMPLTGFLCVFPRETGGDFVERLWRLLQDPETVANLALVGKSYGSGCLKVEPRALERLPISREMCARAGLPFAGPSPGREELCALF